MDGFPIDSSTTDSAEGLGGPVRVGVGHQCGLRIMSDMVLKFGNVKLVVIIGKCC